MSRAGKLNLRLCLALVAVFALLSSALSLARLNTHGAKRGASHSFTKPAATPSPQSAGHPQLSHLSTTSSSSSSAHSSSDGSSDDAGDVDASGMSGDGSERHAGSGGAERKAASGASSSVAGEQRLEQAFDSAERGAVHDAGGVLFGSRDEEAAASAHGSRQAKRARPQKPKKKSGAAAAASGPLATLPPSDPEVFEAEVKELKRQLRLSQKQLLAEKEKLELREQLDRVTREIDDARRWEHEKAAQVLKEKERQRDRWDEDDAEHRRWRHRTERRRAKDLEEEEEWMARRRAAPPQSPAVAGGGGGGVQRSAGGSVAVAGAGGGEGECPGMAVPNVPHYAEAKVSIEVPEYAYATFVTTADFVIPAAVLMHSIAVSGTKYARVVAVTATISDNDIAILSTFAEVVRVKHVPPPRYVENERYRETFTKLRIWQLTKWKKLFYIDTDVLVVRNMDDVFDLTQWAVPMDALNDRYSTGMMLVEPSLETFQDMIADLKTTHVSMELPDLLFLKDFFDRRKDRVTINILPRWLQVYQEEFGMNHITYLTRDKTVLRIFDPRVRGIHYPGNSKPFDNIGKLQNRWTHLLCDWANREEIAFEPQFLWLWGYELMRRDLNVRSNVPFFTHERGKLITDIEEAPEKTEAPLTEAPPPYESQWRPPWQRDYSPSKSATPASSPVFTARECGYDTPDGRIELQHLEPVRLTLQHELYGHDGTQADDPNAGVPHDWVFTWCTPFKLAPEGAQECGSNGHAAEYASGFCRSSFDVGFEMEALPDAAGLKMRAEARGGARVKHLEADLVCSLEPGYHEVWVNTTAVSVVDRENSTYSDRDYLVTLLSPCFCPGVCTFNDTSVARLELDAPGRVRSDGRCGSGYPAPNGEGAGECDPQGEKPCCNAGGYCGSESWYCVCKGCQDFRETYRETMRRKKEEARLLAAIYRIGEQEEAAVEVEETLSYTYTETAVPVVARAGSSGESSSSSSSFSSSSSSSSASASDSSDDGSDSAAVASTAAARSLLLVKPQSPQPTKETKLASGSDSGAASGSAAAEKHSGGKKAGGSGAGSATGTPAPTSKKTKDGDAAAASGSGSHHDAAGGSGGGGDDAAKKASPKKKAKKASAASGSSSHAGSSSAAGDVQAASGSAAAAGDDASTKKEKKQAKKADAVASASGSGSGHAESVSGKDDVSEKTTKKKKEKAKQTSDVSSTSASASGSLAEASSADDSHAGSGSAGEDDAAAKKKAKKKKEKAKKDKKGKNKKGKKKKKKRKQPTEESDSASASGSGSHSDAASESQSNSGSAGGDETKAPHSSAREFHLSANATCSTELGRLVETFDECTAAAAHVMEAAHLAKQPRAFETAPCNIRNPKGCYYHAGTHTLYFNPCGNPYSQAPNRAAVCLRPLDPLTKCITARGWLSPFDVATLNARERRGVVAGALERYRYRAGLPVVDYTAAADADLAAQCEAPDALGNSTDFFPHDAIRHAAAAALPPRTAAHPNVLPLPDAQRRRRYLRRRAERRADDAAQAELLASAAAELVEDYEAKQAHKGAAAASSSSSDDDDWEWDPEKAKQRAKEAQEKGAAKVVTVADLEDELEAAVNEQDYALARRLQASLQKLRVEELQVLVEQKTRAVAHEDFETALRLKEEITALNATIVLHDGKKVAAEADKGARANFTVGATVRMLAPVRFRNGSKLETGDTGTVEEVPGKQPESPATVRVRGLLFDLRPKQAEVVAQPKKKRRARGTDTPAPDTAKPAGDDGSGGSADVGATAKPQKESLRTKAKRAAAARRKRRRNRQKSPAPATPVPEVDVLGLEVDGAKKATGSAKKLVKSRKAQGAGAEARGAQGAHKACGHANLDACIDDCSEGRGVKLCVRGCIANCATANATLPANNPFAACRSPVKGAQLRTATAYVAGTALRAFLPSGTAVDAVALLHASLLRTLLGDEVLSGNVRPRVVDAGSGAGVFSLYAYYRNATVMVCVLFSFFI